MSTISTHVLDTSIGRPAEGIRVTLQRDGSLLGTGVTDQDGRVRDLLESGSSLSEGDYRLTYSVAEYFGKRDSFYNEVVIHFHIADENEHYHMPLLLSPFGYSTYRGS